MSEYWVRRRYQVTPESVDEIVRRADEGFAPILRSIPGFLTYVIGDFGGGDISTFSLFENQSAAEESVTKAAAWVRENLSSLIPNPPQVTSAEVVFRDARPGQATFGVIREYRVDQAKVSEILQTVREGLLPIIQGVRGFVSYLAMDLGNGVVASASTFTDQAAADESTQRAAEWVQRNLASVVSGPPKVEAGRVLLRRTRDG